MSAHFEENAILALAALSSVLASGALFFSLRKQYATPTTSMTPAVVVSTPETTTAKSKDTNNTDDSETEDEDKDKDKEKDKSEIIDDAYKLIHQKYNRKDYKWEDFDPLKDAQTHEGVIFIVYHRHTEPTAVRPLERLVEVHSETLKDVLRGCLKHVDTVFDPKPLV
jgi:hypothetical protein